MADLVLRGGTVVDGTGAPAFAADIAVDADRITAVGDLAGLAAEREIDATGMTIAPGFIDTHAHSDGVLLRDPVHAHGLVQGVTTEFITQDGLSYALLSKDNLDSYGRYIAGLYGPPPTGLDMSTMTAFRSHYDGKGCNVAVQAPHGPVRLESVGFEDVPLEGAGLAKAERMIAEAMEQGATGFSTGLSYYPNSYSNTDELVALNKVVARYDGVYVTHIRNHNDDRAPDGSGIVEAMNIGRRSGVKVHISHYRTFPSNAGDIDSIMSDVDQAKADGVDVTLECYPYAAAATVPGYFLRGECHVGGIDRLLERLGDPAWHNRLVDSLENLFPGRSDAATFTWIGAKHLKHLEGLSFADAAQRMDMSVSEVTLMVMRESGLQCGFRDAMPASPLRRPPGRGRRDRPALARRLHGRLRRHPVRRRRAAPPRIRNLPKDRRPPAPPHRGIARTPRPRDDIVAGEPLRLDRSRHPRRGQVRRPRRLRRRDGDRHRRLQ